MGISGAIEGGVETRQTTEAFLRIRQRAGDYSRNHPERVETATVYLDHLVEQRCCAVKEWIQENYATLLSAVAEEGGKIKAQRGARSGHTILILHGIGTKTGRASESAQILGIQDSFRACNFSYFKGLKRDLNCAS